MEYKRCSSCTPGLGALTGYYQPGQLSPGFLASLLLLHLLLFHPGLGSAKAELLDTLIRLSEYKKEDRYSVVSNLNLRKMETENKPSDTSEICKVSVKIPPFWVEKPEIWFFQVEAQFKIGGIIQEDTKFNYLISQLEPKYIENIWDIINSKSDNKYSECKSRLLELFRESEGLRIKKLISSIELGDMKPSQLLQKLRSLATPDISDNLIKTLWLDKLPTSIKNILVVSEEDISKLAIMADKINEINSSKEIYDAEVPSSSTDRLIAKLEDLEPQVSELRLDRSRSRSKNRTRSRPRSNSQRSFDPKGKYCYYHFRFGPNCLQNNCRSPCNRYPIPRLDDFHHILKGTRVYSKIDLCKAFYQIPIAEEDKPKTAIITPFGLFEFNVMSFGLRNATATFQRFMHEVLRNLDFAFVYLDDILVASKTEEEHYSHLETLFSRLNSYGLRINLSKSKFLVQEIDFLGYLITSHGVKPLPTKVKAILEYKKPKTVHELRIFLGMLNFYRTFLNNVAETQAILHEYLRGAKKKDRSEIKWTKEAEVQFEKCKQALANTALLAYPDTELPISLCTDASDRAVGSVLQQLDNNNWKPIAFFSKKLNPAQCNYSTYDRELLAIYLSIKFFKHLLEAREFTILTDHKPLIYAFKQKNEKASPKQLRHLQYISQFTTDIKYIKGTDNIVADALSRVDAITTIDYEEIAKEQTGDSELQNLISKNTSLKFKQCPLQSGNLLWCDVSTNNIRPFIPIKFRMMVFRNFHELSHPGIKATTKQLTSRFIWPNMNKDIRKWAQACVNCQKCKVSIHTKSEIGKYQEVDERFSVVHIDLIGPLPPSNGNIYCLTCIDRYTSWMEVVPLPDMKSETVARAFYENWIVRFGAPHTVISDQGKQFTSQLFKDLTTLCAPEPFNFSNPGDWPKWIRRFERFRQASGLINNPENEQVNMLVYCMGDNADDILLSCKIASDQLENYGKVIECFESHFIPRRNIIYERARFNQRCQQEGEKVNEFITALHSLAEHCNFGMLHDELIRDRIVVGVRDRALSERMQLDTDLTLVKAKLMAKQLESVKEQQSSLYQQESVDQIKKMPNHIKETKRHEPKIRQFKSNQLGGSSHGCTRCGNSNNHDWKNCPAMNSYCSKCKKKGHYAKDEPQKKSFNLLKQELVSRPNLALFDPSRTTIVSADASSFGLGGVLRQEQPDGSLKPIAYVSRTLSETEKRYSQIEKEGLAIVWTCDRLKDYVTEVASTKMRMMRYSYQISHIAGKKQIVADMLSRKPMSKPHKDELEEELSAYIQSIEFPATEERLLEISRKKKEDSLCSQLAKYCMSGWPKNKREVDPALRGYWQFQEDLTYQNGLLLRGQRILIPKSLRKDILEKLHQGHFGINKCRSRAKESVWWLGISQEIERMVSSCTKCLKERKPKHEPLMPSEFPIRPWQKVGMDLFYLNGRWYLIVCDYYSRYPEISLLQNLTAQEVISRLKSIFARHGTPETVRSDNGPQFQKVLGSEFSKFSKEWSFKHITSSPKFPQSNGFIEAIIKNIKQSFKKEEDCYLTLQAYRTMPLER
ncbi:hypothetical protein LAZ67_21002319, partial [Cordylochernes scorpioides]